MSAIPSTPANLQPRTTDLKNTLNPRVELGKPATSATSLDRLRRNRFKLPQTKIYATSPSQSVPALLSMEPEDAHITGGTRSLDRRLLALNIS